MNRYRTLRRIGCGPVTAFVVAFMNWARGYPANEIRFMHMTLEVDAE